MTTSPGSSGAIVVAVVLAVVIAVVPARSAHADRKQALSFFRAGEKAYQAQSFEAAALDFDEAFKQLPLPEIAFSAAQAYRRAHRVKANGAYVQRAAELYRFYLDHVTQGGRVGDAADSFDDMQRELDKLGLSGKAAAQAPKATRLGVTVSLGGEVTAEAMREIDDAKVATPQVAVVTKIDGKPVPPDTQIEVAAGDHVIRAEAPGFAPVERKEHVMEGASNLASVDLSPLPAHLTIKTERGAQLSLDGRAVIAGAPIEVPAGSHRVTIVRSGRVPVVRDVALARDQRLVLDQPLAPTLRRRAVKWVLVGAGAFTVVTSLTGLGALHFDKQAADQLDRLNQGNQDPSLGAAYATSRDRRDRLVTGTWISGSAVLALGVAAGALYYFDSPSVEGLRVTPIAGSGVGGAALLGRF